MIVTAIVVECQFTAHPLRCRAFWQRSFTIPFAELRSRALPTGTSVPDSCGLPQQRQDTHTGDLAGARAEIDKLAALPRPPQQGAALRPGPTSIRFGAAQTAELTFVYRDDWISDAPL